MLAYPLRPVPLTFVHIVGLKIYTDKSTFVSKLQKRIITDAPRNVDVCIVDRMFPVQSHVDLHSNFGGVANMTLSRLVRRAYHVDFACDTNKYPSINDITREDHSLVYGEVNISGPEQGIPKYFTQTLVQNDLRHLSSDYWQKCGAEMSMLTPCELYFGLMKSATDTKYLMDE